MSEKEKLRKDLSGVQADPDKITQPPIVEILKALLPEQVILNDFKKEFRSLFGEIADLKILSGESPVFDAIGKQNNIIFLSQHNNEKEPSYLRDLVEALTKGNENNKVTLLLELPSDFDLNEMIKLINEDPSLSKRITHFPEVLTNLFTTLGKLKEKYGERLEVILIDIPAFETLKETKDLLELAGIELDSELAKRIDVSEEEFERMSTKQKIETLERCKVIYQMIANNVNEKIERYSYSSFLDRNIKIVENVEKIYNEYKDKDGYNIIFYGGQAHGFEILKELKEVKIPLSQKIRVYLPADNIFLAYILLYFPTSKELAKTDALGEALRR